MTTSIRIFKAVTPLHVPIVHFMMEESENAENVSSSIFYIYLYIFFLIFSSTLNNPEIFFSFLGSFEDSLVIRLKLVMNAIMRTVLAVRRLVIKVMLILKKGCKVKIIFAWHLIR